MAPSNERLVFIAIPPRSPFAAILNHVDPINQLYGHYATYRLKHAIVVLLRY